MCFKEFVIIYRLVMLKYSLFTIIMQLDDRPTAMRCSFRQDALMICYIVMDAKLSFVIMFALVQSETFLFIFISYHILFRFGFRAMRQFGCKQLRACDVSIQRRPLFPYHSRDRHRSVIDHHHFEVCVRVFMCK